MRTTESLAAWLRRRKLINDLEYDLMALHFDLEGALADGQPGLAWVSQDRFLHSALLQFVAMRRAVASLDRNRADRARIAITEIERWNAPLAERTWDLVLRPVDLSASGVRAAVDQTMEFVSGPLGIDAATRSAATRTWAEGVVQVRKAAALVGLAGSESWYLPQPGTSRAHADWYDEVMSTLQPD